MHPLLPPLPPEDAAALEALLRWLAGATPGPARDARLGALARALAADAPLAARLRAAWTHASAIRLLAETGLPDQPGLLAEGLHRAVNHLVPRLDPEGDLYALLARLGLTEADGAWVAGLELDALGTLPDLLRPTGEALGKAARLLAHRAAALGLSREILALLPHGSEADSPFFDLTRAVQRHVELPADGARLQDLQEVLATCRQQEAQALDQLEDRGVSTELVYRLELLEAQLVRLEALLALLRGEGTGQALAADLVQGAATQDSLRRLARTTLKRLARKVVEHTGESGEHYIAGDRGAWRRMGWAAAGGGLLTVGTALAKYALAWMPLAPLLLGVGLAANYTLSFAVMQLLGLALASKQPALTAAALARTLELENGLEEEVELVAAISRTQSIAAVGNVLVAAPAAFLLAWGWGRVTGQPLLSAETARHGLQEMHLLASWTLPFAALTGVFLWLSSLASGWAANWSAFRQLPAAVEASPRIRTWLGASRAAALGRFLHRHFAGLVGYAALGFLLGFIPVALAKFAGVGLGVRHITLQSAAWALDLGSLWGQGPLPRAEVLWSLASIPFIGLLNFSVSFALALRTATRARGLDLAQRRTLRRALVQAFLRDPWRFVGPPPR